MVFDPPSLGREKAQKAQDLAALFTALGHELTEEAHLPP